MGAIFSRFRVSDAHLVCCIHHVDLSVHGLTVTLCAEQKVNQRCAGGY